MQAAVQQGGVGPVTRRVVHGAVHNPRHRPSDNPLVWDPSQDDGNPSRSRSSSCGSCVRAEEALEVGGSRLRGQCKAAVSQGDVAEEREGAPLGQGAGIGDVGGEDAHTGF